MRTTPSSRLDRRATYLQVAMNGTLGEALATIAALPASSRIIIEAGTPLIKREGASAIRAIQSAWGIRLATAATINTIKAKGFLGLLAAAAQANAQAKTTVSPSPDAYVVADMKTIDRGATEVAIAAEQGARAVIAMGSAPVETLNAFIAACASYGVDAMIDMMNVESPVEVLGKLKRLPSVVVLHRGVDEERDNKEKMLPLYDIRRLKGAYDMMIAVAGGDTPREIQSTVFNDANIVVVWKATAESPEAIRALAEEFLQTVK